jgi:hypothetical protein
MFTVDRYVPVNAGLAAGEPRLSRDQVWQGLMMKARDAKPFVHKMSVCDVTKAWNGGLDREIVFHDMPMGERLFFYPKEKVVFLRTHGAEMGTITNEIVEDDRGELLLRFAFTLEREGMPPDSPEERAFAENYGQGYLVSVQKTIDAIRALVKQGKLKAAPAKRVAAKRAKPQRQTRAKSVPKSAAKKRAKKG